MLKKSQDFLKIWFFGRAVNKMCLFLILLHLFYFKYVNVWGLKLNVLSLWINTILFIFVK